MKLRGSSRCFGRRQVVVILLFVTLHASSAFFFRQPKKQTAKQPIDTECEAKVRTGDCDFYACFDERHPCGDSKNYAINYGWKYCSRFDLHKNELTAEGRRWLNGTRVCSMEKMLEHYRAESISCSEVEETMKEGHSACEAENGLCRSRVLTENKDAFLDVYSLSRQSITQFLYSAKQCSVTKFQEVTSWFRDQFHDIGLAGESVLAVSDDLEGRVKKLKENLEEEVARLSDSVQQFAKIFLNRKSGSNK